MERVENMVEFIFISSTSHERKIVQKKVQKSKTPFRAC